MNNDIKKFGVYKIVNGRFVLTDIKSTDDYDHSVCHIHHFIPQSIRKNNPDKYDRIEVFQRLIKLDAYFHLSLPNMRPERVKKLTGLEKWQLLYNNRQTYYADLKQFSRYINKSPQTVYKYVEYGIIRPIKKGKFLMFDYNNVLEYELFKGEIK